MQLIYLMIACTTLWFTSPKTLSAVSPLRDRIKSQV
ncbi:unnamed protein product [Musa hybrid cultivar]